MEGQPRSREPLPHSVPVGSSTGHHSIAYPELSLVQLGDSRGRADPRPAQLRPAGRADGTFGKPHEEQRGPAASGAVLVGDLEKVPCHACPSGSRFAASSIRSVTASSSSFL